MEIPFICLEKLSFKIHIYILDCLNAWLKRLTGIRGNLSNAIKFCWYSCCQSAKINNIVLYLTECRSLMLISKNAYQLLFVIKLKIADFYSKQFLHALWLKLVTRVDTAWATDLAMSYSLYVLHILLTYSNDWI